MQLIKITALIVLILSCSVSAGADRERNAEDSLVNAARAPRVTIKVLAIDTLDRGVGLDRTAESFDLFVRQLEQLDHLQVNTPRNAPSGRQAIPDSVEKDFAKAKSLIRKGRENLLNISLDDAAESFQSARVLYRKNLMWLDDPEPLIDALMGLAEALATMGDKEAAMSSYQEVLCLNPDFEPDPGQVPTKLRMLFEDVRQDVTQRLGGQLSASSIPEGANVRLDGLTIGNSPVLKDGIPPGLHFLQLVKDGFRSVRKVVEIQGGQTADVREKLSPLPVPGLIRRLRASLGKDSVSESLEIARDLGRMMEFNAVICSQLTKPAQSVSPVFSVVIIPTSGQPGKLAVVLPDKNAGRVLQALALQISDTLDEGSAPVAVSSDLGLDFKHSLLGTPVGLTAPTLVSIPPGVNTNPSDEKYPGPVNKQSKTGPLRQGSSVWTSWWLWTAVGAVVAGGVATTLALSLGDGEKMINDPDRVLIRIDTSPER